MLRLISLILPLTAVLVAGPIWLAITKRGLATWFPAQVIVLAGLIAGIVALRQEVFGEISGPTRFLLLSAFPFGALMIAWIALPGRKSD